MKNKMRAADFFLIAALLVFAVLPLFFGREGGNSAIISVGGEVRLRLPLSQNQTVRLPVADGELVVEVKDGMVRVLQSPCPDKLCEKMGAIGEYGGRIACLPERVLVVTDKEAGVDAYAG